MRNCPPFYRSIIGLCIWDAMPVDNSHLTRYDESPYIQIQCHKALPGERDPGQPHGWEIRWLPVGREHSPVSGTLKREEIIQLPDVNGSLGFLDLTAQSRRPVT